MDRIARRADWSSHRMCEDLRSTIRLGQTLPSNEGLRQGTAQGFRRAMDPVTMALDLQMYRGRVGDPITILAKDDVGLISVEWLAERTCAVARLHVLICLLAAPARLCNLSSSMILRRYSITLLRPSLKAYAKIRWLPKTS